MRGWSRSQSRGRQRSGGDDGPAAISAEEAGAADIAADIAAEASEEGAEEAEEAEVVAEEEAEAAVLEVFKIIYYFKIL